MLTFPHTSLQYKPYLNPSTQRDYLELSKGLVESIQNAPESRKKVIGACWKAQ
jgi:hypothetical protein